MIGKELNPPHQPDPVEVEVRECTLDVIDVVEGLEYRIFKPSEVYSRGFLEWLCRECSKTSYLALVNGRYVGYVINCIDRPGQGHVVSLGVVPEFRRMGIGRALLCRSICALAPMVDKIVLEVRVSNQAAIRLYESLGFKTHHRIPHYYSDGEDAYFMILEGADLQRASSTCRCSP